jgi:ubiquinone/menaquinone biosynthesis C-methylase UbiE
MKRKIKTALMLGDFAKGSHILEIGCADGVYTFEFIKLGFRVTGLDLSPACVAFASQKASSLNVKDVSFIVGDAEELCQFPDNTFDGAISFSTLRYVPNPQKAINEIFRVVKKNKIAVCDFPNRISPWFNYLKPWLSRGRHIHDHSYFTHEIEKFFYNAGFREIVAKRILYTPKFIGPVALAFMKIIDRVGELAPLDNLATIIMCRGKKP